VRLYVRAQRESRKRQILELAPRIALNFARLLHVQNKPKTAIRTLEPLRTRFDSSSDAYQYFGTLAELYEDAGRMRDAAIAWNTAKVRADAVGNQEYASYCAAKKSRSLAKLGKAKLSQQALVGALKTEQDPARRANLLIQRLELLIGGKSSRDAQGAFDEALRICKEHQLHEQKSELYLLVGDHGLSRTYLEKLNAFKAYTMAMLSAVEGGMAGLGKVAPHILFKIASADSPLRDDEIARLVHDLKKHLSTEAPNTKHVAKFLLWPFDLALRLFPFRKQPRRFLAAVQTLAGPKNITRYLAHVSANGSTATKNKKYAAPIPKRRRQRASTC